MMNYDLELQEELYAQHQQYERNAELTRLINNVKAGSNPHLRSMLESAQVHYEGYFNPENCTQDCRILLLVQDGDFQNVDMFYCEELRERFFQTGRMIFNMTVPSYVDVPVRELFEIAKMEDFHCVDVNTTSSVNNNCCFPSSKYPIIKEPFRNIQLNFRSPAELKLFHELRKYNAIIYPGCIAVINDHFREPDFHICFKGRQLIVEIVSDSTHCSVVKEASRCDEFERQGIPVKLVTYKECINNPEEVARKVFAFMEMLK